MKDLILPDGWVELHFIGNAKEVGPVGMPEGSLIATLGGYSLYSGDGERRPQNKKVATLAGAFTRSEADVICKLLASGIYSTLTADSADKRPSKGYMVKYSDWVTAQHQLKTDDTAAIPGLLLEETKNRFSHSVGVLRLNKRTKLSCTHIFYRPWASNAWSITAGQVHEAEIQLALHSDASKSWFPTSSETFQLDQKHKRLLVISLFAGFWRSQNLIKNSKECAQTIGDLLGDSSIRPSSVSADLAEAGCRPLSPSLAKRLFRELIAEARSLLSKRTRPVSKKQTFEMMLAMVEPELFSSGLLKDVIDKD